MLCKQLERLMDFAAQVIADSMRFDANGFIFAMQLLWWF